MKFLTVTYFPCDIFNLDKLEVAMIWCLSFSVFTLIVVEGHEECRESCLVFTGTDSAIVGSKKTGVTVHSHTHLHMFEESRNTKRLIWFFSVLSKYQTSHSEKPQFDEC